MLGTACPYWTTTAVDRSPGGKLYPKPKQAAAFLPYVCAGALLPDAGCQGALHCVCCCQLLLLWCCDALLAQAAAHISSPARRFSSIMMATRRFHSYVGDGTATRQGWEVVRASG